MPAIKTSLVNGFVKYKNNLTISQFVVEVLGQESIDSTQINLIWRDACRPMCVFHFFLSC